MPASSSKLAPKSTSKPAFKYELNPKIVGISERAMLDALRAYAHKRRWRSFSGAHWDSRPDKPFAASLVSKRFGSWRAGLQRIGLKAKPFAYKPEELIAVVERVWQQLGRPPGKLEFSRRTGMSPKGYVRLWGGLRRTCELIAQHHAGKLSRQDLLHAGRGENAPPHRIPLSHKTRYEILKRDHFCCTCCGASPAKDPTVELEIDHIKPLSRGGGNEKSNLRTLCRSCNQGRRGE